MVSFWFCLVLFGLVLWLLVFSTQTLRSRFSERESMGEDRGKYFSGIHPSKCYLFNDIGVICCHDCCSNWLKKKIDEAIWNPEVEICKGVMCWNFIYMYFLWDNLMVFSPTPNQGSVSLMFKPGYALIENIQVLIKISLSFFLWLADEWIREI